MIKHNLIILGAGHDPKPEIDDFEVVHVIYKLETAEIDETSNVVTRYASTASYVELDPWDVDNKTPGKDVTKNQLMMWLSEKIDLEKLQEDNIKNLQPK